MFFFLFCLDVQCWCWTHSLFAICGSALASCFEVAYYTTCPCHKSTRVDVHGKTKERKCKKEMTVTADASEPLVIRMLAWWLSSGSCAAGLDDMFSFASSSLMVELGQLGSETLLYFAVRPNVLT